MDADPQGPVTSNHTKTAVTGKAHYELLLYCAGSQPEPPESGERSQFQRFLINYCLGVPGNSWTAADKLLENAQPQEQSSEATARQAYAAYGVGTDKAGNRI
ncbi:hypothetical protein ACO22_06388 [Paracoccidioides brasiliensis]|uniref:Uncharacterized protein n=1 Tax=Paracoccidioides brasiliensis TaxID=121759 RepID=A0A1D2J7Q4_PARBR|nr:hypothetical protein ACO22_06388 [Paracoccidioides brasiliensis]